MPHSSQGHPDNRTRITQDLFSRIRELVNVNPRMIALGITLLSDHSEFYETNLQGVTFRLEFRSTRNNHRLQGVECQYYILPITITDEAAADAPISYFADEIVHKAILVFRYQQDSNIANRSIGNSNPLGESLSRSLLNVLRAKDSYHDIRIPCLTVDRDILMQLYILTCTLEYRGRTAPLEISTSLCASFNTLDVAESILGAAHGAFTSERCMDTLRLRITTSGDYLPPRLQVPVPRQNITPGRIYANCGSYMSHDDFARAYHSGSDFFSKETVDGDAEPEEPPKNSPEQKRMETQGHKPIWTTFSKKQVLMCKSCQLLSTSPDSYKHCLSATA